MTPKEKAEELVNKMGKEHALITVAQIQDTLHEFPVNVTSKYYILFWEKVNEHIQDT